MYINNNILLIKFNEYLLSVLTNSKPYGLLPELLSLGDFKTLEVFRININSILF